MRLDSYLDCLRLNLRLAGHALRGRWLGDRQVAASYDRLAADYETHWLVHLRETTDALVARLPAALPPGRILDLGCGTGHGVRQLSRRYPDHEFAACDIAAGMLAEAGRQSGPAGVRWEQADMLEFLHRQPPASAALVFSAWALGYSRPAAVIQEAARVLVPGGCLAFVVNLADTLAPLSLAFRVAMQAHPEAVACAIRYRFPRHLQGLSGAFQRAGLSLVLAEEGRVPIPVPAAAERLPWLLKTGTLAGFDAVLPLRDNPAVARTFEQALAADPRPVEHHYAVCIGFKPAADIIGTSRSSP